MQIPLSEYTDLRSPPSRARIFRAESGTGGEVTIAAMRGSRDGSLPAPLHAGPPAHSPDPGHPDIFIRCAFQDPDHPAAGPGNPGRERFLITAGTLIIFPASRTGAGIISGTGTSGRKNSEKSSGAGP